MLSWQEEILRSQWPVRGSTPSEQVALFAAASARWSQVFAAGFHRRAQISDYCGRLLRQESAGQRGARNVAHRTLQAGQDALPVAREGITDSNYER
jgi:hypothetical protein